MRKANIIVTICMIILLLVHMVLGSLELYGVGGIPVTWVSRALVCFVFAHALIGTILTIDTIKSIKKSGAHYFKENKLFWLRRFSGFLIIIALVFHLIIFMTRDKNAYRLQEFTTIYFISQILLVIFIAIHVISNVKPTLISFGITGIKKFSIDILFVLSIVFLIVLIAFIVYYIRWQVI